MIGKRLKVLLIVEQCNPDWTSAPLVGYRFFDEISKLVEVTLVTHERNRAALKKYDGQAEIIYMPESKLIKYYYKLVSNLVYKRREIWPLYHALTYLVYEEFNRNVYNRFKKSILRGEYDVVHALTPIIPRYPVKVIDVCKHVPFLLGPVNGGVPFPPGFQKKARKEHVNFNFLRTIGRWLLPGYAKTYKKADRILAGSTYTLNLLKKMFHLPSSKISLFYENGVPGDFFTYRRAKATNAINLLFVGRLVPYKCADILLEAISRLEQSVKERLTLTVVGNGSEEQFLQQRVDELGLNKIVHFVGWVSQEDILSYYAKADIFCFPSIREFGGAVVLEAMACGLPCIVVNNGGIGEYVTAETGFKIDPVSRDYLTQELANKIQLLVEDDHLRMQMSIKATERAKEFIWSTKGRQIVEIYEQLLSKGKSLLVLN